MVTGLSEDDNCHGGAITVGQCYLPHYGNQTPRQLPSRSSGFPANSQSVYVEMEPTAWNHVGANGGVVGVVSRSSQLGPHAHRFPWDQPVGSRVSIGPPMRYGYGSVVSVPVYTTASDRLFRNEALPYEQRAMKMSDFRPVRTQYHTNPEHPCEGEFVANLSCEGARFGSSERTIP